MAWRQARVAQHVPGKANVLQSLRQHRRRQTWPGGKDWRAETVEQTPSGGVITGQEYVSGATICHKTELPKGPGSSPTSAQGFTSGLWSSDVE